MNITDLVAPQRAWRGRRPRCCRPWLWRGGGPVRAQPGNQSSGEGEAAMVTNSFPQPPPPESNKINRRISKLSNERWRQNICFSPDALSFAHVLYLLVYI